MPATPGAPPQFRVLGPLEVRIDGRPAPLRPKHRQLLAALLTEPGKVVSAERLARIMWDGEPPANPSSRLRTHVTDLRRALREAGGDGLIATRAPGYLVDLQGGRLDVDAFTAEREKAAAATDPERALAHYDAALALWRGPALGGVPGAFAAAEAARLGELRLATVEDRTDTMLELGRHADLLTVLTALTAEHPSRQRPHAQLMLAHYRSGRVAEALEVYRRLRATLGDELGVEPLPEIRRLHREILAADPSLSATGVVHKGHQVRQLPAGAGGFTGREHELALLDGFADAGERLVLIAGPAGSGKTALAVHWGHRRAGSFPDGNLFVNLRGFDGSPPVTAAEVLPRFLQALGLAATEVPGAAEDQAARYRSMLAGRRMLIVLDNVAAPEQVRPLLPGEPGCLVVATSRQRLGGLAAVDGARRIGLDVLDTARALDVLGHAAGRDRLRADPHAAGEIAALCGHLPLALRIAGARIADRPRVSLRRHADDLRRGRLARLRLGGDGRADVRAALALSYETLPEAARGLFRLLAVVPQPSGVSPEAAAALTGTDRDEAAELLDVLAAGHLATETATGRYVMHDLVAEYSAELAAADERAPDAAGRLLGFHLHSIDAAGRFLTGVARRRLPREEPPRGLAPVAFTGTADANEWLHAEYANLAAAVDHAVVHGPREFAWLLADALHNAARLRFSQSEVLGIIRNGLDGGLAAGDRLGEAAMRCALGFQHMQATAYDEAFAEFTRSLDLYGETGYRPGAATAYNGLAMTFMRADRSGEAVAAFASARDIHRELGDVALEMQESANLAGMHMARGDLGTAITEMSAILPVLRESGNRSTTATTLHNLAFAHRLRGDLREATDLVREKLELERAAGSRQRELSARWLLGVLHLDAGRHGEAEPLLAAVYADASELGNTQLEMDAEWGLARIEAETGRAPEAVARLDRLVELTEARGYTSLRVEALLARSVAHTALGAYATARDDAVSARGLLDGSRIADAHARRVLAAALLGLGDVDGCLGHAGAALDVQREAGQRLEEAHTLTVLARAHTHAGHPGYAGELRRRAADLYAEAGAAPPP